MKASVLFKLIAYGTVSMVMTMIHKVNHASNGHKCGECRICLQPRSVALIFYDSCGRVGLGMRCLEC